MSLRRENTAPPRFYGTSLAKRQPRASFTPPQQTAHQVIRRGSLGVIQSNSAEKKLLFSKRSNSLGGANDDYSPTKLDFQSLKKRPSLLGTGKLKSGNKETEAISNRAEKHSMVILGAGGVGKTGKHSNLELSLKSLQTFKRKHICILSTIWSYIHRQRGIVRCHHFWMCSFPVRYKLQSVRRNSFFYWARKGLLSLSTVNWFIFHY